MKNITCACAAPTSHRCEHLDMSRHRCLPPKSCGRPVCDEHSVEWPHDVRWCVQCAAGMHPMRGLTDTDPDGPLGDVAEAVLIAYGAAQRFEMGPKGPRGWRR